MTYTPDYLSSPVVPDPTPTTYNLLRGARRWRDSLGSIRDASNVNGRDIVVIGDSRSTYGDWYSSWPHYLKVMLQDRFNNPETIGGYGFMPFGLALNNSLWNQDAQYTFTVSSANATATATYKDNTNSNLFTVLTTIAGQTTLQCTAYQGPPGASGTLAKQTGTGDSTITYSAFATTTSQWADNAVGSGSVTGPLGLPCYYVYENGGRSGTATLEARVANNALKLRLWRMFDGTAATARDYRQYLTDWEYVGLPYSGVSNAAYCDHSTSTAAITPSNLVPGSNSQLWGDHWTRQTGLTYNAANNIQVASPGDSTNQLWANGVIAYCNDTNNGIRLHNLSMPGATTSNYFAAGSPSNTQPNIDQFCTLAPTASGTGARRASLILIALGVNDCGTSSSTGVALATFITNLQTAITTALAEPSRPCVGLLWDVNANTMDATRKANYPAYQAAVYQLAAANDNVFVVDFWKTLDNASVTQYADYGANSAGGAMHDRGWYNDGVHGLASFNENRARQLFAALTYGV